MNDLINIYHLSKSRMSLIFVNTVYCLLSLFGLSHHSSLTFIIHILYVEVVGIKTRLKWCILINFYLLMLLQLSKPSYLYNCYISLSFFVSVNKLVSTIFVPVLYQLFFCCLTSTAVINDHFLVFLMNATVTLHVVVCDVIRSYLFLNYFNSKIIFYEVFWGQCHIFIHSWFTWQYF